MARGFLNESLKTYYEDNNFDEFLYSLEIVLKARQSLKSFSEEANLNRSNLYDIFRGEKNRNLHTVLKILAQLGYTIKVALAVKILKKTYSKNNKEIVLIEKDSSDVVGQVCPTYANDYFNSRSGIPNRQQKTILIIGVVHGDETQGNF